MSFDDPAPTDAFSQVVFDDEFVAAAPAREPAAEDRGGGFKRPLPPPPPTRRGHAPIHATPRRVVLVACAVILIVIGLAAMSDGRSAAPSAGNEPWYSTVTDGHRPTPAGASSTAPLGVPAAVDPDGGPYEFIAVQPTGEPVTYDPCRPIHYIVNEEHAPAGTTAIVHAAVQRVAQVTGLQFVDDGQTDEPPTTQRLAYQPDRYGDRWAPVLIAWSDPVTVPDLAGDVAGVGGSSRVVDPITGRMTYVSGVVFLDTPTLTSVTDTPEGVARVRGVVLHELSHVVGLDHTPSPGQLMNATARFGDLRPGDMAGLAQLGRGPCVPTI